MRRKPQTDQATAARYADATGASVSSAAAGGTRPFSLGLKLKGFFLAAGVTLIVPVSALSALALPPSAVKRLAGSVLSVPADIFRGDEAISELEAAANRAPLAIGTAYLTSSRAGEALRAAAAATAPEPELLGDSALPSDATQPADEPALPLEETTGAGDSGSENLPAANDAREGGDKTGQDHGQGNSQGNGNGNGNGQGNGHGDGQGNGNGNGDHGEGDGHGSGEGPGQGQGNGNEDDEGDDEENGNGNGNDDENGEGGEDGNGQGNGNGNGNSGGDDEDDDESNGNGDHGEGDGHGSGEGPGQGQGNENENGNGNGNGQSEGSDEGAEAEQGNGHGDHGQGDGHGSEQGPGQGQGNGADDAAESEDQVVPPGSHSELGQGGGDSDSEDNGQGKGPKH